MPNLTRDVWTKLSNAAVSSNGRLLLAALLSLPNERGPGVVPFTPERWATLTGLDRASVMAALEQLERAGFVLGDAETDEVLLRDFFALNPMPPYAPRPPMPALVAEVLSSRIRAAIRGIRQP